MKTGSLRIKWLVLLFAASSLHLPLSLAQGTAFTYQGRLNDGANPASGLYDLQFALYDAASSGTQQGGFITHAALPVSNGLFTVVLDFGDQYTGANRWLEIAVRASGVGNFFTLNPRQALTPIPYAMYAANSGTGGSGPWLLNGSSAIYNAGAVGIGVTNPASRLSVFTPAVGDGLNLSGTAPAHYLSDTSGLHRLTLGYAGGIGFYSADAVTGDTVLRTEILGAAFMLQNGTGAADLLLRNHRFGIGTPTPQTKLDVRGDIAFGASGELRPAGSEENLRLVRGSVDVAIAGASINVVAGSGFTASIISIGHYRVTFDRPFAGVPTVTASAKTGNCDYIATIQSVGLGNADIIVTYDSCGDGRSWSGFHFIAVGPR